jgi:hypothetical protein
MMRRRTAPVERDPMTPLRPFAIAFVFLVATAAWVVLGGSVLARSGEFDDRLSKDVALLWGGAQVQRAPAVWLEQARSVTENVQVTDASGRAATQLMTRIVTDQVPVAVESTRATVDLALDHRRKGLLWYDTYSVALRATYHAHNPAPSARTVVAHLAFPSEQVQFDNFRFRVNGQDAGAANDLSKGATVRVEVPAGGDITIELGYDSRGLDTWTYLFAESGVAQVHDFLLTLRTNFEAVDFPAGSMSPSATRPAPGGLELDWRFENLLTGRSIGIDLPNRQNPGPLTARITFFAPVSLLFFMTVMVILGVLRSQNLHPVHYAFLSAAFFAFHLLLAYLVDHLSIHLSFAIAAATSVLLVTSYLRIVTGPHFAIARAGVAQIVFLVLFSYAFFFEGYTGLTVTVGAILTLFVLMQATARVDWTRVLSGRRVEVPER